MKSEWKVTSNPIEDKKMYGVYRIKDTSEVDHSGNRESVPLLYVYLEDAQREADELNKEVHRPGRMCSLATGIR